VNNLGRRKDYVTSRSGQIPSLKGAADQLIKKLEKKELKTLFVATDAPIEEFEELK
jgi:peptide-O-fucosyltransferase